MWLRFREAVTILPMRRRRCLIRNLWPQAGMRAASVVMGNSLANNPARVAIAPWSRTGFQDS
jgi:hypothetical protein